MRIDPEATERNTLLEKGADSYPKAMYALSEFRRLVQEACVAAMKRNLKDLGAALGLRLEGKQVKRHAWPDKLDAGDFDGSKANLGAKILTPGDAEVELWNYINWGDDPPFYAAASIVFTDSDAFSRAWARMPQQRYLDYSEDGNEIMYWRCVRPEDLAQLESLLNEMNKKWAKIWRDLGGVKQFLERS